MPVQRWRLRFERGEAAAALQQRDIDEAWQGTAAGFRPADPEGSDRPRIVIGAPLPVGMTAALEVADLFLPERRRVPDVREVLEAGLPPGHRLVELHDVWLGGPALPGLVVAGDYRVHLGEPDDPGDRPGEIRAAVRTLLATNDLPRVRTRGARTAAGNLRPFILDVAAIPSLESAPEPLGVWMRVRFHPTEGTGRPEEVTAALGAILGRPLRVVHTHRERLWLQGELPG